jgi:hypothetical protein
MADITLTSSFKVRNDVVFRDLNGEAVILSLDSGIYFGLDATGTRMWHLIERYGRLDEVLSALCQEYDAPAEAIERDLLRLAAELTEKGLITPRVEAA